jgi:hypothetical protein
VRGLLASAAIACAVLSSTADAASNASFTYDRELGRIARESLWHSTEPDRRVQRDQIFRAYVRCYRSERAFERAFEQRYGVSGEYVIAYYAGSTDVFLRQTTCNNVRMFVAGRHTLTTSAAFSILLHEVLHRQGVRDERITTCLANEAVRWGTEWLGFSNPRALRARQLAFDFTRRYSPPEYRMGQPHCHLLNRRTDWPDHRVVRPEP